MGRPPWLRGKARGLSQGYRSGLEERNAEHIRKHGQKVRFECLKIKYPIPASVHTYTPDFLLDNGIIVETKGRFLPVDRAKHLYVKMTHPELDIRFVFSNPNAPIAKGSKTTLAYWADSHGYKWAAKLIPIDWLNEERGGRPLHGSTIPVPPETANLFADCPRQPLKAKRKAAPRNAAVARV